tara:strand:- start:3181 stop:3477 length:297 start_codon:yes stop_codon:yes gene_type:complete
MNFFEVKTANYNVLVPVEHLAQITGNTTSVTIKYGGSFSVGTESQPVIIISGFGTLSSAADGYQTVYDIVSECAQNDLSVPLLKINGNDELTVSYNFG